MNGKMRTLFAGAVLVSVSMMMSVHPSEGHMGATGVVKERMGAMKAMAAAMKGVGAMVRGERPFDGNAVAAARQELARHAERIPELFPEGSGGGMSEARPSIWTQGADFSNKAAELAAAARALAETGRKQDQASARQRYRAVGKSCSACHKAYRAEKH